MEEEPAMSVIPGEYVDVVIDEVGGMTSKANWFIWVEFEFAPGVVADLKDS